jgi:hypothetical protein
VPSAIAEPVLIFAICILLDFEIEATVGDTPQAAGALAPNLLTMLDPPCIDVTRLEIDALPGGRFSRKSCLPAPRGLCPRNPRIDERGGPDQCKAAEDHCRITFALSKYM